MGMGMQGTPAKKGRKLSSRVRHLTRRVIRSRPRIFRLMRQPMGAHSTPATRIKSRSRSDSTNYGQAVANDATTQSPTSSLDSSFPSSAELLTTTPPSDIPELSSPSIPGIQAQRLSDVFDAGYKATPPAASAMGQEEWEYLVTQAEESPTHGTMAIPTRGSGLDALYAWKKDITWSVRGESTSSATGQDHRSERDLADQDSAQDATVYYDAMTSLNDRTARTSPSSQARKRSSTITNRRSTPYKQPNLFSNRGADAADVDVADESKGHYQADSANLISIDVSLNDRSGPGDISIRRHERAIKIKERRSTPHKSSSQPTCLPMQDESLNSLNNRGTKESLPLPRPLRVQQLSELLQSTQPDPQSQAEATSLWASTQESGPGSTAQAEEIAGIDHAQDLNRLRFGKEVNADSVLDNGVEYSRNHPVTHSPSPPDAAAANRADDDPLRDAAGAAPVMSSDDYAPMLEEYAETDDEEPPKQQWPGLLHCELSPSAASFASGRRSGLNVAQPYQRPLPRPRNSHLRPSARSRHRFLSPHDRLHPFAVSRQQPLQ